LRGLAPEDAEIRGWKIIVSSWKINNAESKEQDEDKCEEEKCP